MQKILSISLAMCALAAAPAASAQDAALVDAGAQVYEMHCAECHGERLRSTGVAFNLKLLAADERPRFDKALGEGKGQMPAWKGTLSAEQFDQLWAYIRSKADN
jgi:mono/diheme cytochrome c family protein